MQRSMGFYDTANLYPDSSIGYLVKVCNQLGMAIWTVRSPMRG